VVDDIHDKVFGLAVAPCAVWARMKRGLLGYAEAEVTSLP